MKIEFNGTAVEISSNDCEDFTRCAEAAFLAAGYTKRTFAECLQEWIDLNNEDDEP